MVKYTVSALLDGLAATGAVEIAKDQALRYARQADTANAQLEDIAIKEALQCLQQRGITQATVG